MYNEKNEELFSLKLNSEGINHIYRFARVIRLYLVIGIVFLIISLSNEVLLLLQKRVNVDDWLIRFYFSAYPIFIFIGIVIFILQLVYFRKLSLFLQSAVKNIDELTFNAAFENLTRIGWVVICNAWLAIIYSILNLVISIRGFR